jgi:3-polyprenyl-4-hydroxybenzoate decarboxylase
MNGSPLEPSSPGEMLTSKVGFECTKPLGKPFHNRLSVPEGTLQQIDAIAILGHDASERIPVEPWG